MCVMTKEVFIKYVQELVLPLFTGSHIAGEDVSTSRDSEVAQGTGGTMLVKPHKEDEYRLIIKRSQSFKSNDIDLMHAIIEELDQINDYGIKDEVYIKKLQSLAMEKAICKSLTDISYNTLLGIIAGLDKYARKTYEGNEIKFGIVINEYVNCQNKNDNLHYSTLFRKDFFSVLSNGEQTCLEIDKEGYLLGHVLFERLRSAPTICPYDYTGVARYCNNNRIGVILLASGEILLFKNYELMYAKKGGSWGSYCHDEIIQLLSNKTNHTIKEIRKQIYFTSLDCSFARTGGCIVYLDKDDVESALTHIDINDIINEKYFNIKKAQLIDESHKLYNFQKPSPVTEETTFADFVKTNAMAKSVCLKECIADKKFHELSRKFREEIVGVDGATIIDNDGTIIAIGAIVQIEAGSSGGGRLAATKTLAKYGVAIKISADGIMQAFIKDKKANQIKPIFTVG